MSKPNEPVRAAGGHRRNSRDRDVQAHVADVRAAARVIVVSGEVDLATGDDLCQRVKGLAGPAPQQITLDLTRVGFIDCAGLRALDDVARSARAGGGGMHVSAMSPAVGRVVALAEWPDWS